MAGQSTRDIKRRIRSVRNMQHITRAFQLVSAAKLRRVQGIVLEGRPYINKLEEMLARLTSAHKDAATHPLLLERPITRVAYCVFTADRGLAGGYNMNVIRLALQTLQAETHPYTVTVIGKKGRDYLRKRNIEISAEYLGISDDETWHEGCKIARRLADDYIAGRVDAVYLVYTEFRSTIVHRPVVKMLLPLQPPAARAGETEDATEYIVEPSIQQVLDVLAPRYMDSRVQQVLLEAKASEHGARMAAMRSATDNAEEMIEHLTFTYNRARQASITKEISEIVGGAEALAGGEH